MRCDPRAVSAAVQRRASSTVFEGGVIFDRADIAGIFYPGKEFHGSASFWKLKVGGDARFAGTLFKTVWTSFVEADFAGNLTARNAKFGNKGAYFLRMKVGGDADFDAVEFEGPANFVVADITGNLQVGANAKFREAATFDGMKVRGRARFTGAMFEGPVSFTGTDIAGDFNAGAKFQKGALFLRMKVGGDASFNHASFEGPADLRYAEFSSLDMSGALWPTNPAQFRVQGVSYKTIVAAPKEPKSHEELLKVVSKATYSADVYSRLEEFFYAKVTELMQTKHSLQEKFGSAKNTFAAVTGLGGYAAGCSTSLLAMGVNRGGLAFPVPFWLRSVAFFSLPRKWNRKTLRTRPEFTIAFGIASACSFLLWTSNRIKCGSQKLIRLF
jgi:uncharacterized protein YjbI with pentapeptide repeats